MLSKAEVQSRNLSKLGQTLNCTAEKAESTWESEKALRIMLTLSPALTSMSVMINSTEALWFQITPWEVFNFILESKAAEKCRCCCCYWTLQHELESIINCDLCMSSCMHILHIPETCTHRPFGQWWKACFACRRSKIKSLTSPDVTFSIDRLV